MIEVSQLTKNYGPVAALRGISFRVEKGETLGFLGPNGAGKTTAMKIITCYQPATSGTARVAGFEVHEHPLEVKRRIGYLPENVPLYAEMTVTDYLDFVADIKGLTGARKRQRKEEVMETCSLTDGKTPAKLVGKLSRGFKQRVGLAQALIHDPEILILDEPTLGLDPKQIIEVRQLIRSLAGVRTIILCSHILPEVSQTCKRVVIINEGNIVATDTPENLTDRLRGVAEVLATVSGPAARAEETVRLIDGVKSVSVVSDSEQESSIRIESELDVDIRTEVARSIVNAGIGLLELKQASMSLEDIFLRLTTEESEVVSP